MTCVTNTQVIFNVTLPYLVCHSVIATAAVEGRGAFTYPSAEGR